MKRKPIDQQAKLMGVTSAVGQTPAVRWAMAGAALGTMAFLAARARRR